MEKILRRAKGIACIGNYCIEQIEKIDWQGRADWISQLLSYEKVVYDKIQTITEFHEGMIAKNCLESVKNGGQLFIGNSMPIRDVDMFTSTFNKRISTFSNRGASGIDGVVSTALGVCIESANPHSLLLIGDLSFYHDMNGLLASKYGMNLTMVVINNSGAGIFSFLPIANAAMKNFQQFLTTDTGLNIEKVAELYNCRYYSAQNISKLENCIKESIKSNGVKIIEVKTVINENIMAHRYFLKKVKRLISDN